MKHFIVGYIIGWLGILLAVLGISASIYFPIWLAGVLLCGLDIGRMIWNDMRLYLDLFSDTLDL